MIKLNMQTTDVVDENIKRIGEMFPNCLTEVKDEKGRPQVAIDFDQLRQELSKNIVEGPEERYQFTWPDKRNAIRLANAPTTDTLRPCREESVDFDNTQNLYIEGDNLQVLKLLRENYLGKVKMIYIDPPYNTGNDFVYNDNFDQDKQEYVHNSGQYDEEGHQLVTNTESNGRFHTDWLNMIYPRLKVAKDLLSEDGAIFISIDDNEVDNLRKVCDEIFGSSNFVAQFIWKSKPQGGNDNPHIVSEHEYILMFAKKIGKLVTHGRPANADKYKYKDEFYDTRGGYSLGKLDLSTLGYRSNLDYAIQAPDGTDIYPGGVSLDEQKERIKKNTNLTNDWQWRWSKERFNFAKQNGFIVIKKNNDNKWGVYAKEYQNVDRDGNVICRELKYRTVIDDVTTVDGTVEIREMLGNRVFSFPKPINLLSKFIKICANNNSIVLDFFSGSSSTAHSLMKYNLEEKTSNIFIMIQLPERTPEISGARNAGYKNICEIGKERIRRAGKKIKEEHPEAKDLDTGFRVLKLDSSNMENVYYTPSEFNEQKLFDDNIKSDRTEEDLLFQTMIELGIELSAKIEQTQIAGKTVWNVSDGYLMACFDEAVNETIITEIAKQKPYYFVMRDKSLANDNVADNFEQIFNHYSKDTIRRIL